MPCPFCFLAPLPRLLFKSRAKRAKSKICLFRAYLWEKVPANRLPQRSKTLQCLSTFYFNSPFPAILSHSYLTKLVRDGLLCMGTKAFAILLCPFSIYERRLTEYFLRFSHQKWTLSTILFGIPSQPALNAPGDEVSQSAPITRISTLRKAGWSAVVIRLPALTKAN